MINKKIIVIFSLVILLFLLINTNVFASDVYIGNNEFIPSFDEYTNNYQYFCVVEFSNRYYVFLSKNPLTAVNSDNVYVFTSTIESDYNILYIYRDNLSNYNTLWGDFNKPQGWTMTFSSCEGICISNYDIYNTNNSSEVFFFKTLPLGYRIQSLNTISNLPKVIVGTMKVIMPVGLGVLSVILVIFLIKSVILRMK